jgi:ATP-dependent Clp protease ATP-binding subunit ClpA
MSVHFKPEILNRIGRNIVVFNYISEGVSKQIVDMQITRINDNLRKESKINVVFEHSASEFLYGLCLDDEPRKHGGRGIGNVIEEQYLNQLAEFVYDNDCREGDSITVKSENGALIFVKG